jgi:hypothetical protein
MRVAGTLVLVVCAAVAAPLWASQEPPTALTDSAPAASPPVAQAAAAPAPEPATTVPASEPAAVASTTAAPAAAAPPASAPSPGTPSPTPPDVAPNPALPARTDITIDRSSQAVAGIGFGGPLGATFRLDLLHGLGADVRDEKDRVKAVCALPIPHCGGGFLLGAEAGSGGGKLSLGIGANARVDSEDFKGTVGVDLKASLAHTWGSPVGTEPGLTYLGPELDLYVLRFGVGLGALWRVSGSGGSSVLFTWGLGFRL